jgi:hypothetical protein
LRAERQQRCERTIGVGRRLARWRSRDGTWLIAILVAAAICPVRTIVATVVVAAALSPLLSVLGTIATRAVVALALIAVTAVVIATVATAFAMTVTAMMMLVHRHAALRFSCGSGRCGLICSRRRW